MQYLNPGLKLQVLGFKCLNTRIYSRVFNNPIDLLVDPGSNSGPAVG